MAVFLRRGSKDEGERPFWISYADLMTALMMLFLVVMAVSLFAVTSRADRYEAAIDACMEEFRSLASRYPEVQVDVVNRRVNFGERARFPHRRYDLTQEDVSLLRRFVPVVLEFADSSCGRQLLKRVVVEGYTSRVGSYLYNLDLSLKRAHSVLCALLDERQHIEPVLTEEQKRRIRELFMVGGYSFNAAKASEDESRRVELKLEFWALDEKDKAIKADVFDAPLGECQLAKYVSH